MSATPISSVELDQTFRPLAENMKDQSFDADILARSVYSIPTSHESLAKYIVNVTWVEGKIEAQIK